MKVIKNVLPKKVQEQLKDFIFSKCPLYYLHNVTFKGDKKYCPAFGNSLIKNDAVVSEQASLLNVFKETIKGNVINANLIVQLPLNSKVISKVDQIHIDNNEPHQVFLYYVNDSDGDTVIYKNKKEWKRFTPKQGSMITFDGSLYHSAEQPKKGTRCVINLNVTSPK